MSKADRQHHAPRAQRNVFPLSVTRSAGRARPEAEHVTPAGADWLASASIFPRSVHALWRLRPTAPSVLPCGSAFDVVSTTPLYGRRLLDRLWSAGPGSGPVAVHRGRMLLFAAPGTAERLPALLGWEEWQRLRVPSPRNRRTSPSAGSPASAGPAAPGGSGPSSPALLCHGPGDAVTVPALLPPEEPSTRTASRWLVAPDVRTPWLPGPEMLLWACLRTDGPPPPAPAGPDGTGASTGTPDPVGASPGRASEQTPSPAPAPARTPAPDRAAVGRPATDTLVVAGRDGEAAGRPIFAHAAGNATVYDVSRRR